jgi:PucR family transcriptional regulator, purine catabolism regulatory protein
MAITARLLAQAEGLGLSLVAGRQAADRDIAWAHAIELPDPTPYLDGGELVMTTGINVGGDRATQFGYVERLASAGTAALAVDTGTTLREVPAGVLAAGDELGLAILEVPASTPFIAIARVVVDALKADELTSVQRVVDHQEVLARATLRHGVPGVVAALADSLSATVAVADTGGRLLAAAGGEQSALTAVLSGLSGAARQAGLVTADGDAFVTVQKLRAAGPVRGHLAVRSTQPLSNSDRLLVAHALSLISITLEKPARVVDAEHRLRTAVTRELLCSRASIDSGVLRYFGFEPNGDVVVVVLDGPGPSLAAEQVLAHQLATSGPYLMATVEEELIIVAAAAGARRRMTGVIPALADRRGGLSRPVRLDHVAVGLEQARIAARSGRPGTLTGFDELGALGVVLGGRSTAELQVIASPLTPLGEHTDDLVDTLAAFLTTNGQVEAAAAALGVHRHTMRNRLARISELLADDLQSASVRTQLWLAIHARKLLVLRGKS